jgi:hypothetical protein
MGSLMSMNEGKIDAAMQACIDFMQAVEGMRNRRSVDPHFRRMEGIVGFKETAEVRRHSMTLTRALAELRRPS